VDSENANKQSMFRTISSSSSTPKIVRRIVTSRNVRASYGTNIVHGDTRQQLLELLRHTAQPVAVVTALMRSNNDDSEHRYHGATLSSFASIAMDPYPLISFALRIPSRMACSLKSAFHDQTSHMVVNLLSSEQAAVAVKFSRPDLYPEPFHSVPFTLTQEGLPILDGSLGSLSCQLVSGGIPLHDLSLFGKGDIGGDVAYDTGGMAVSELFIGRVVRVERLEVGHTYEENLRTLPLIYHRRGYTSCLPPRSPIEFN
jgi:flavin reductase (DIM6/NTAB) family NADH-FMN oxidoreductase RutF